MLPEAEKDADKTRRKIRAFSRASFRHIPYIWRIKSNTTLHFPGLFGLFELRRSIGLNLQQMRVSVALPTISRPIDSLVPVGVLRKRRVAVKLHSITTESQRRNNGVEVRRE